MAEVNYKLVELPNGIRVVYKQSFNSKIAHCGVALDIGSRDELDSEQGMVHFWEHMAFKGSEKRKAFHILNRLESLGGDLNAYTTKEKIFFYSSSLDIHIERALELLADITFNSAFPQKEIEKERGVILEEMAMYEDSAEDAIFDDFDELVFKGHSLGRNILGTRETLKEFDRSTFLKFVSEHLDTSRMVVSIVSPLPFNRIERYLQKYFSIQEKKTPGINRSVYNGYAPLTKEVKKPIQQVHALLGVPAFDVYHKDRVGMFVLNQIVGGNAMISRLNLALREKAGMVYGVESNYSPFTDTGLFSVYFATDLKNVNKATNAVHRELKKLKEISLGTRQLSSVKERICAQLAMAEENNSAVMQMMAKSVLDQGKVSDLEGVFSDIRDVSASTVLDIANQIFDRDRFTQLTYIPENGNS